MAAAQQTQFSPAELAYLHSSLSRRPPIRPDGRGATQFRPLTAETGILPGANGSARVCFSDGTEALVGVKAEMEKTALAPGDEGDEGDEGDGQGAGGRARARSDWLEMTIEIPGLRDDDAATAFLAEMLREALLADGEFAEKLCINRRFHWRMYLDVSPALLPLSPPPYPSPRYIPRSPPDVAHGIAEQRVRCPPGQIMLISPPLSYPLPLLSLTTHLALLATRLPRLKSEGDEDPMFDDDWEASRFLYPRQGAAAGSRPPLTFLVVAVGDSILFDPAKEELAVADAALAVSVSEVRRRRAAGGIDVDADSGRKLRLLSLRTVDPPSRMTPPGVPDSAKVATSGAGPAKPQQGRAGAPPEEGVWRAPLGGTKFAVLDAIIQAVLEPGGPAHEVLDGLEAIDLG